MASRFEDEELTNAAERRLQILRRDLKEIQEAIREAEQMLADSKRQQSGLMLRD